MKKLIVFIALILSFTLIITGCGNNSQEEEQEAKNVENSIVKEQEEDTPKDEEAISKNDTEEKDEDEESSLTDLFSKTRNMDTYYYEVYSDLADGTSYVTKVWFSENKTKMESHYPETGENIIMIINGEEEVSYLYMPAENMAIKMKYDNFSAFTEDGDQQGTQDYMEIMRELADDEEINIENGTFEGESVKIVTGIISGNTNKVWISNKTGFPLKSEFYMDGELESSAIFKNFEEKSIDSTIFTIPEDVEIQDMTNY